MNSFETEAKVKPEKGSGLGLLARIRNDQRGNTLALMAAALLPIAGMIGSGLDMSRAYLAKAKLQTACDAAALATRRFMGSTAMTDAARAEGRKFFYFNFPAGTMETGAVALTIESAADDASEVEVKASTTVPTAIMHMFGKKTIAIETACNADQDYVNNDIMLVLDVTGSMNCAAGTSCSYQASEATGSRLSRLRSGAIGLYRALAGATGVRTRYGIVPYSMTVSTGHAVRAKNSAWIRDPGSYWYRETYCSSYYSNGSCRSTSTRWAQRSQSHNSTWFSSWQGCLEERSTISQSDVSNLPRISTDVTQADIDSVSTTDNKLKWQPYDTVATTNYTDSYANLASFCPAQATRLNTFATESAFQTAINTALSKVGGYTNHDLGIVWGMRFLSSTGMFAAENPTEFSATGGPAIRVDKHIVFMTDGVMTVPSTSYSSFGHHAAEDRWVASGTDIERQTKRFLNACNRARQMGATIWVIALDVQAPDAIKPCASGDSHFYISDGSDLDEIFELIGKGIGKLRITK
jgi:Flp pilus assembly protein TadG